MDIGTENNTRAEVMKEDSVKYFLVGLKIYIKDHPKWTQEKFAMGISTAQYFSKLLNFKANLTDKIQGRIEAKLDVDTADIVLLGRQTENKIDKATIDTIPPGIEHPDLVTSLTQVISSVRRLESELVFWQSCLAGVLLPICVIDSEGIVVFQNQADRSLYKMNVIGEKLCPACRLNDDIPHPCKDCAIERVLQVGEPVEKHFSIGEKPYRLIANPIKSGGVDYVVVVVVSEL